MRISRSTYPPRRTGRGFFVGSKRLIAAATFATLAFVAGTAQASTVTVKFAVSAVHYAPIGALCPVQVPAGSDGIAVLNAAKAKHCIVSYKTQFFPGFGYFVRCIDGLCEIDKPVFLAFWAMYRNGKLTPYGVSGYSASQGDTLEFVYSP